MLTLLGKTYARGPFLLIGGFALLLCLFLAFGMHSRLYWDGDHGIFLVDMFNAAHLTQSIGISSRFGWSHPGPINYYALLPWFYLSSYGDQSLILGTFFYNCMFVGASVYLVRRLTSRDMSIAFMLLGIGYIYAAVGAGAFFDVLLPSATLFPWLLALAIALAVVMYGIKYAGLLALVLTYVAQMHVAFWLPAATLAISACALSFIFNKFSARDFVLLAVGLLCCLVLWLPPLLELDNLKAIFGFFRARPSSEHTVLDGLRALFVLSGEPLLMRHLNYANDASELPSLVSGVILFICFLISAGFSIARRDKLGLAISAIILVQIVTYVYAFTKVTGPILYHSVSFFPLVSIFMLFQVVRVVRDRSSTVGFSPAVLSALSVLVVAVVAPGFVRAIDVQPDVNVKNIYQSLSAAINTCGSAPTIIMNQDDWPAIIGAVSAVYRDGGKFDIYPPNWGIVFGGRVATDMTDCQISFSSVAGHMVLSTKDYADVKRFTSETVLERKNLAFTGYGGAHLDPLQYAVQSSSYIDSGFVSQELTLAPGEYKISVDLSWNVTAQTLGKNGAQLSIYGQRMLWAIPTSASSGSKSMYFTSDGLPFRVSFGLGGWAMGKGEIRLNNFTVVAIHEK